MTNQNEMDTITIFINNYFLIDSPDCIILFLVPII